MHGRDHSVQRGTFGVTAEQRCGHSPALHRCWKLIRYADDLVICVKGERQHAEMLHDEVTEVLAPLGLALAPDKTRVVGIDKGFDFLGFHIRRMRRHGTRNLRFVYTVPSEKAKASIRTRTRWHTRR